MNYSSHCNLCEHRQFNMQDGTRCGLTGERPLFDRTCLQISFGERLEEVIKEINIELELIKRTKGLSYANFIVYLTIAIAFIGSGIALGIYLLTFSTTHYIVSTVPFIVGGIGIAVLPKASGPLNKYRQGIQVAKEKKEGLDQLLLLYNIDYDIDIKVNKDLHGNIDTKAKVMFNRMYFK